MKGYKIFIKDKDALLRQVRMCGSTYNPIQDTNGDWFIFEDEYRQCHLGEEAEFIAPIIEVDPIETITGIL